MRNLPRLAPAVTAGLVLLLGGPTLPRAAPVAAHAPKAPFAVVDCGPDRGDDLKSIFVEFNRPVARLWEEA